MRWFWRSKLDFYSSSLLWVGLPIVASSSIAPLVDPRYMPLPLGGAVFAAAFEAFSKYQVSRLTKSEREREGSVGRRCVSALLTNIHEELFKKEKDEHKFMNRTTLFLCDEVDGVKSLFIYARSGRFPTSSTRWKIDDDDQSKCEGFAGDVWFHNTFREKVAECHWPEENEDEAVTRRQRHANSLRATVEQTERLNVKSNALVGTIVWAGGRKRGVLILDSLKEDAFASRRLKPILDRYAGYLSSILGEIDS